MEAVYGMMRRCGLLVVVLGGLLLASGCGTKSGNKPTYPVVGRVLVDGAPADYLAVTAEPADGQLDPDQPTVTACFTDKEGRFSLSTYVQGDGVPEGEYVLTFMWGQMNLMSMNYGGPDKLKGRYSKPETSQHRFTVGKGQPKLDLGDIELSTN